MLFPIHEEKRDATWSIILCSFVMSFGVCLDRDLRKVFEDAFSSYKRKFKMAINSQAQTRPTIFDIYYDVERLSWEVI